MKRIPTATAPPSGPARLRPNEHRTIRRARRGCVPRIEVFEDRTLLSGNFTVSVSTDGPEGAAPDGSLRWAEDGVIAAQGGTITFATGVDPNLTNGSINLSTFPVVINAGAASITSATGQPIFIIPAGGNATIRDALLVDTSTAVTSAGNLDLEGDAFKGGGLASETNGPTTLTANATTWEDISGTAVYISAAGGGVADFGTCTWTTDTGTLINYSGDSTCQLKVTASTLTGNDLDVTSPGLVLTGPSAFVNVIYSDNIFPGGTAVIKESAGEAASFTGSFININESGTAASPVLGGVVGILSGGTINFTTVTAGFNVNNVNNDTGAEFYFTGYGAVNFVSTNVVQTHGSGGIYNNGPLLRLDNSIVGDNGGTDVIGTINSGGYDNIVSLDATTNPNGLPAHSTSADPEVTGLTPAGYIIVAVGSPVFTTPADPASGEQFLGSTLTAGGTYTPPGGGGTTTGGGGGTTTGGGGGTTTGGGGSTTGNGGGSTTGNGGGNTVITVNGFNGVAGYITVNGDQIYLSGQGYFLNLGSATVSAGKQVFKLYHPRGKVVYPKLVGHPVKSKAKGSPVAESLGDFALTQTMFFQVKGRVQELYAGSAINITVSPKFFVRTYQFLSSGRLPLTPF